MKLEDLNFNKTILNEQQGNDAICSLFEKQTSFMVSRADNIATALCSIFIKRDNSLSLEYYKDKAFWSAGISPTDNENLLKFSRHYCDSIKSIDIMGVWSVPNYDWLANTYCPDAQYTRLWGLEPYHFSNPWSINLQDKNVLVIHPFAKSIKSNYKNRCHLFNNPDVLPQFNLLTLKPFTVNPSIPKSDDRSDIYLDYFKCIELTTEQIKEIDFDIAIIGCGSSGLPISSYIKNKLNKIAIHMGGATQILFGIIGKRWEDYPQFKNIINDYWTRPLPEERPSHYIKLDKGCYW